MLDYIFALSVALFLLAGSITAIYYEGPTPSHQAMETAILNQMHQI